MKTTKEARIQEQEAILKYPACHKLGLSTKEHFVDNAMSSYAVTHALGLRLDEDEFALHCQAKGELLRILIDIKTNLPEAWEQPENK